MNFRIRLSTGDGLPALYSDLSEAETFALGELTAGWAILEHLMLERMAAIAKRAKNPLPKDVALRPFGDRLAHFNRLVARLRASRLRTHLASVSSRIAGAQTERNDLTHGIWDWQPRRPDKVSVSHARKKTKHPKLYGFKEILALSRRVAEINFALSYPRGVDEFFKKKAAQGSGLSRAFAIAVSGAETDDPTLKRSLEPLSMAPASFRHPKR